MIKFSIFAVWNVRHINYKYEGKFPLIAISRSNANYWNGQDQKISMQNFHVNFSVQVLKVKTHYTIYILWLFIRPIHTIVLSFLKLRFWKTELLQSADVIQMGRKVQVLCQGVTEFQNLRDKLLFEF